MEETSCKSLLLSWLVPALPAKSPILQSFNSSLHSLPSVSGLYVAQRGITDNMTFGGRNTSNNSALTLPASFAKMVTAERMLKSTGGETRQTQAWFAEPSGIVSHNRGLYWPMVFEGSHQQLPKTGSQGPVA